MIRRNIIVVLSSLSILTSSLSAVSLTTINVDTFLTSLNGYITSADSTLSQFTTSNLSTGVSEINTLAQCFGSGFDLSTLNLDGLCSILSIGQNNLGFTSISGFFSCVAGGGLSLPDLGNLCKSGLGSLKPSSSPTNNGGWEINAGATEMAIALTPEYTTLNSNGKGKTKPIKDVKFMGKDVTGETLYGGANGGEINKRANTVPAGVEANAVNSNDNKKLWLMEQSIASGGINAKLNDYKLPINKEAYLDGISKIVGTRQGLIVDYSGAIGGMAKVVQPKYLAIQADTVEKYYNEEVKVFKKHMSFDTESFQKLIEMNELETKLSDVPKKTLLANDRDYIFDPTEATARKITASQENNFRFNSFLSIAREMEETDKYVERTKIKNLLLQITVKRAYTYSSMFPESTARQEVLNIVKKVDQTQR